MIISAILIFLILFGFVVILKPTHPDQLMYAGWLLSLAPLLVFSGIGFILYDIAAKDGIEEQKS
jgi:hypothetical protein